MRLNVSPTVYSYTAVGPTRRRVSPLAHSNQHAIGKHGVFKRFRPFAESCQDSFFQLSLPQVSFSLRPLSVNNHIKLGLQRMLPLLIHTQRPSDSIAHYPQGLAVAGGGLHRNHLSQIWLEKVHLSFTHLKLGSAREYSANQIASFHDFFSAPRFEYQMVIQSPSTFSSTISSIHGQITSFLKPLNGVTSC